MSNVLEQLTIIIPFRAESKERTENLVLSEKVCKFFCSPSLLLG